MERYNEAVASLKDTFRNTFFSEYDPFNAGGRDREIMESFYSVLNNFLSDMSVTGKKDLLDLLDNSEEFSSNNSFEMDFDPYFILQLAADGNPLFDSLPDETLRMVEQLLRSESEFLEDLFVCVGLNNVNLQNEYMLQMALPSWSEIMTRIFFEERNILDDLRAPDSVASMDPSVIVSFYLDRDFDKEKYSSFDFFKDNVLRRDFEKAAYIIPGIFNFIAQRIADPESFSSFPVDFNIIKEVQHYILLKSIVELLVSGSLATDDGKALLSRLYLIFAASAGVNDDSPNWSFNAGLLEKLCNNPVRIDSLNSVPFTRINRVVLNFLTSVAYLCSDDEGFIKSCSKLPDRYDGVVELMNSLHMQDITKEREADSVPYTARLFNNFTDAVSRFMESGLQREMKVVVLREPAVAVFGTVQVPEKKYTISGTIGESSFTAKISTELIMDEKAIMLELDFDIDTPDPDGYEVALYINFKGVKKRINSRLFKGSAFHRVYKLDPMIRISYSLELSLTDGEESLILFSAEY